MSVRAPNERMCCACIAKVGENAARAEERAIDSENEERGRATIGSVPDKTILLSIRQILLQFGTNRALEQSNSSPKASNSSGPMPKWFVHWNKCLI